MYGKDKDGNYPLLEAIKIETTLLFNSFMNISYRNEYEKNKEINYLLLEDINKINTEIVKLLIEYANENNIILELNEKK